MATAPVRGIRVPIKLPFKGATDGTDQFVAMKEPVAKALKFDVATISDLNYQVKVTKKKNKKSNLPILKNEKVDVTRRRRPGYRQRSVRIIFQTGGGSGIGLNKNPTVGAKIKVGSNSYKSLQFPITNSIPIEKVLEYFEKGNGKDLKALKVVEVNTGQSYPLLKPKSAISLKK
ncbi:hypothetical protein [Pleurocapsa sp. FMAR1]|uniref:hypothetical protein n=1 Tax=Pleurocapsa sp. FMAR1 TaxID=3040204 RepID=UPI0029C606ED|nr:hypothetical protein [Pleurocapsa sp. FMAR1]